MKGRNDGILRITLESLENGFYFVDGKKINLRLSRQEQEQARCYLPEQVYELFELFDTHASEEKSDRQCFVHVENEDTFEAARKMYERSGLNDIAVLNFANPKTPGRGVRRGARAQEETLCLRSSLLKSLESAEADIYYKYNSSKSFGGSDAVLLSNYVEVIRDRQYSYLGNPFIVTVLSCAAPMVSPFSHRLEDTTEEEMEALLSRRILSIMAVLISVGIRSVVLGAWGCGAFFNDPVIISRLFHEVFKLINVDRYFDEICFAILAKHERDHNFEAFRQQFNDEKSAGI